MHTTNPRAFPLGLVVSIALLGASCTPTDTGEAVRPVLVDVTAQRGPDFVHDCGPTRTYFLPELMGPGTALLDYDNDGDLDAYFINAGPPPDEPWQGPLPSNRLFRQEADGRFVDVTSGSGLDDRGYGQGVAVGDYDNDGFVDVYVTNFGMNRLFRNRGDGSFEDVTQLAGVGDRSWSTAAAFCDFDADGHLDLYVANYLLYYPKDCPSPTGQPDFCGPQGFEGTPDGLYHNEGDGTFSDVTEASGVVEVAMKGLGVVCSDLTGDGRLDFYVANDQEPNQLWVGQEDGRFRDEAVLLGAAFNDAGGSEASMGLALADLDDDSRLDLYVTHLRGQSNTAYLNQGSAFRDATSAMGLHAPTVRFTGFGVAAVDLEHDGDLDLVVVNGHVFRASPEPGADRGEFWNDYAQPGLVLLAEEDGRFADVSVEVGSFGSVPEMGRSLAVGDVDSDGDLDFLVGYTDSAARLFLNESPKLGHWLMVRARDERLRRDAYGALITVHAGERSWTRQVNPATSYFSSHDPRVHVGLGDTNRVDAIEILWLDGLLERFPATDVDRVVDLVRGAGERVEASRAD